ncbi:MAG: hypothetical protein AUJ72_02945 [Candidatus Omnitrophica bacterium CG1_02_46_14]|nr:MAG: hypothetical protein AUJ72_02945 [Candidatus Omnitrophica bacterium CG1_02_46_14]
MDHPKKVLILYASAGHGHEKAAQAIYEACRDLPGGQTEVKLADTIKLASPFYGNIYRRSYMFQIQYIPWLWGVFYFGLDQAWIYGLMSLVRRFVNSLTAKRLERAIIEENPDTIIAVHFQSTEVSSHLKETGKIKSKLINLVTDYLPHHIWLAKYVDTYVVALKETKEKLMEWGVTAEKIKVLGIPVEKKFMTNLSISEVRSKLSLDPRAFTVLITSGGAGIGSMKNLIDGLVKLNKPIQILAVCGTNRALLEILKEKVKIYPLLKVFGFVNNMNELMSASDLVIGKGGGLTITESLSQGKPLLLFESIPGQESRNAECILKYKAGFVADSLSQAVQQVGELVSQPDKMESVKKGAAKMYVPDSASAIARLAVE